MVLAFVPIWFIVWEMVLRSPQWFFYAFAGTVLWIGLATFVLVLRRKQDRKETSDESCLDEARHSQFDQKQSLILILSVSGFTLSALLFLLFLEKFFSKQALLTALFGALFLFLNALQPKRRKNLLGLPPHQNALCVSAGMNGLKHEANCPNATSASSWCGGLRLITLGESMAAASLFFFHAALFGLLVFLRVSMPLVLLVEVGALFSLIIIFFRLNGHQISWSVAAFLTLGLAEIFWALSLLPTSPMVNGAVFAILAIWSLGVLKAEKEKRLTPLWFGRSLAFSSVLLFLILVTARWT